MTPDPDLFGGTIAGDPLTEGVNLLLALLLSLVVWMSGSWSFTDNWGEYFALLLWSTVGMMLLVASEELLTLFLTLEMMTICLYLVTAFEKDKRRSAEGGLKYFVYGSVSSALFLFGLSLIYGLTGSTRLSAIHEALAGTDGAISVGLEGNVAGAAAVLLVLAGFGFKIAAVPFHQWAPDAYEGAPAPVTAWVATGSKVASFIALMKVLLGGLGAWSTGTESYTQPGWLMVVAALSAVSMTYGNLAALAQTNFKRMLAYSSIAHAGYMLVGVAAAGMSARHVEAAGSVLFYLLVYSFSNVGAFAVAAWLARDRGSDRIDDLNGLGIAHPGLGVCIVLLMLSLIGMPPLAGFYGKLYMFMEALDQSPERPGRTTLLWLVSLGLLNSVISAFYYVRVLKAMFLRPAEGGGGAGSRPLAAPPRSVFFSIAIATAVVVGLGVYPGAVTDTTRGLALTMLSGSGQPGSEFDGSTVTVPTTGGIPIGLPPGQKDTPPEVSRGMPEAPVLKKAREDAAKAKADAAAAPKSATPTPAPAKDASPKDLPKKAAEKKS